MHVSKGRSLVSMPALPGSHFQLCTTASAGLCSVRKCAAHLLYDIKLQVGPVVDFASVSLKLCSLSI